MPLLAFLLLLLPLAAVAQNPIHVTYLWHMHQPIYYPYETVTQTDNAGHFNFSVRGVHDQRTGAYGEWPKNAVQQGTDLPHAGVQVSFSGSLMENMNGLYGFGWRDHYRWGRNGLRTTRNNPRLDLVGIAYHHSLMPLTTKEAMRMQIRLHKEAYADNWATGGSYTKGFWPPECAFDTNMIPALLAEGIEWVIVDNGHFDRACEGFPWAPASSIRPNKADQLNPDPATRGSQWVQLNNVWAPTKVSAPWGYQPHRVQYVNPETGVAQRIIAVPAGRYEGNENGRGGYGAFKPENVWGSNVAVNNDPQRPMLILCHSDGDNFGMLNADAYNGQHGSFLQMTRTNANFKHTSVQDYLELYPVPQESLIHVEPGSWVGIDGGTPYFDKWRENNARDGEHPDLWSWSVLVAAANRVIHADNLESNYSMNDVRWGIGSDTAKAWRYFLQAETSCHWYWDFDRANPWDGNTTRGANLAIAEANKVIARSPSTDRVGPTIWPPQRDIWNPGSLQFNETTPASGNFTVFTFVDDVNALQSVKLKWRLDLDGVNPINEIDNEVYATNSAKVGPWQVIDMTGDWYPTVKGPKVPEPANRAQRYRAMISGQSNALIDYFVEATDTRGNVSRSDIARVWVGNGTTGGGGGGGGGGGNSTSSVVTTSPAPPVAGQPVTITYNPAGRSIATATSVNIHHGNNGANWTALPGVPMTNSGGNWTFTYTVPETATTIAMVFNNGSGVWDNNNNTNFNFSVSSQPPPTTPPAAPANLTANATAHNAIALSWSASANATGYKVFRNGNQIGTPAATAFTDTGLDALTTYSYFVRASNQIGDSGNSNNATATTPFTPVASGSILIVDPASIPEVSGTNYTFRGRAGANFTSGLRWTNNATGQNGTITFPGGNVTNGWEWTANIPLGNGTNTISFTGLIQSTGNQTLTDSPMNYTGFSANATGGEGFGQWYFDHSTTNAGAFLATKTNEPNLDVGTTKGFGLWANNGGRAAITRSFNTPMKSGDSFNVKFDNNWIADGAEVGMELRSGNGTVRFRFSFTGGQSHYRIVDAQPSRLSTIGYTEGGIDLTLSLGTGNTYTFNTSGGSFSGNLAAGDPITWIEFFNNNAGPDTARNLYIGAMTHTVATTGNQTITQNSTITRVANTNTDGVPNTWWDQYNFTNSARVGADDHDRDGFTNAQEHALGTDPTSAASRFMVHTPERTGNNVTINWPAVSGKTYRVQAKSDLSAPWVDVGSAFTANSTNGTQTIPIPEGATKQFYRIRLVPQ